MVRVKHFNSNSEGRDFIIGDLHGCFDALTALLAEVKFNEKDRLFSVGDLIDRGGKSVECLDTFCSEPNYHAILGNHEQMMIDGGKSIDKWTHWYANGGNWANGCSDKYLNDKRVMLSSLPHIITIGEGEERINIVHAELLRADCGSCFSNDDIDSGVIGKAEDLMWGRMLIDLKHVPHGGLSRTFVGHTPSREVKRYSNHHYIDTAAVFGYFLTAFCIQSNTFHQVLTKDNLFTYNETSYENMLANY